MSTSQPVPETHTANDGQYTTGRRFALDIKTIESCLKPYLNVGIVKEDNRSRTEFPPSGMDLGKLVLNRGQAALPPTSRCRILRLPTTRILGK
jgi:hypothetical protein